MRRLESAVPEILNGVVAVQASNDAHKQEKVKQSYEIELEEGGHRCWRL